MFNISIIAGYVIPHMHKGEKTPRCILSKAIVPKPSIKKELQPSMCVRGFAASELQSM
jgi:hypothetical protein